MAKRIQVGEAWAVRRGDEWYVHGSIAITWGTREERKRMARDEARRLADGVYGARVVHVRFYEVRR